ncbi:MAG: hypothetical protein AOA66_0151 [Candidatus Bathyarchaeota archaeon BA2]|nr:MAG: hypothetical protein AOA66_0151 [Candidatus Bathyarchaeota archaeon BA2]
MISLSKEAPIKEKLGGWLESYGCLIYDERKNRRRPGWGIFNVEDAARGKPDLVIGCRVKGGDFRYVAMEVKRATNIGISSTVLMRFSSASAIIASGQDI